MKQNYFIQIVLSQRLSMKQKIKSIFSLLTEFRKLLINLESRVKVFIMNYYCF